MIKFFRHIRKALLMENKTSKYFKYAIGEIILVVIGILIALQVNNWNESRLEQKRIRQYATSLIQDLKNDIKMLSLSQFQALKKLKAIDRLKTYVNQTSTQNLSNTELYVVAHDIIYRPYIWSRATLNELKNSGALRYITNDSLQKKLVDYESLSNHLDEDFEFDKSNSQKTEDMMAMLLNLNSSYIAKIREAESDNFNNRTFDIYQTEAYKNAKANDLKLLSYDEALIQKLVNTLILIQENYDTRAQLEMPQILENANELITLLTQEYKL